MKVLRLPTKSGTDWWVITHTLAFSQPRLKNCRPIHALTFLSQLLISGNKNDVFRLSMALENKLFAVRHNLNKLRASFSKVGDPIYDGKFDRDYDSSQEIIADLEAYLNSIYSVLEIVARLNKKFEPTLPQNFRKQSKKYKLFSFNRKKWLKIFYDLRTELVHFNTTLPAIKGASIFVEFQNPAELEYFKKGKYNISIIAIYNFYCEIIKLLDRWAKEKFKKLDKNQEIDISELDEKTKKLSTKKIKVKDVIRATKSFNILTGTFAPPPMKK